MNSERLDLAVDLCESNFEPVQSEEENDFVLSTVKCAGLGPFNSVNRNNRIYPKEIANNILTSPYVKEMMKNKTLLGEPHHPDREEVWCNEVSHSITKIWLSEDELYLMIQFDILNTPSGKIVNDLVNYGCNLAVSARASGKVTSDGEHDVVDVDTYDFKTFDIVTNPGFVQARFMPVKESKSTLADDVKLIFESGGQGDVSVVRDIINYCNDNNLKKLSKRFEGKRPLNEGTYSFSRELNEIMRQRDVLIHILECKEEEVELKGLNEIRQSTPFVKTYDSTINTDRISNILKFIGGKSVK